MNDAARAGVAEDQFAVETGRGEPPPVARGREAGDQRVVLSPGGAGFGRLPGRSFGAAIPGADAGRRARIDRSTVGGHGQAKHRLTGNVVEPPPLLPGLPVPEPGRSVLAR